jgi:hypothetical protein
VIISQWRRAAAPNIAGVLAATARQPSKQVRAALRAAYPFGERKHYPYKVWLDEIHVQTGRRTFGGSRWRTYSVAGFRPDERQTTLDFSPAF